MKRIYFVKTRIINGLLNFVPDINRTVCHFDPEASGEKSPREARQRLTI